VPGAADVKAEQAAGLPVLRIIINREKIARYGINISDVLDVIEASRAGRVVGTVFEGQKRFDLVVRLSERATREMEALPDIPIADPAGRLIPLGELAEIRVETGPAQVSREDTQRRTTVECNVRGRDLGGFVKAAQEQIRKEVDLPPGYYIEWGGEFENMSRATLRLAVVVPVTLLLIFVILYLTFGSVRHALLIYLNVPMALTGGVFALYARDIPFSISAGVGFIALFGIAVLNGVVLVSSIRRMEGEGLGSEDAAREAAGLRLRPVLMTALVASLGFLPMALSTSAGAEVQRPLATVVIGGLVTSTLLTLLVIPAVYGWFSVKTKNKEI